MNFTPRYQYNMNFDKCALLFKWQEANHIGEQIAEMRSLSYIQTRKETYISNPSHLYKKYPAVHKTVIYASYMAQMLLLPRTHLGD